MNKDWEYHINNNTLNPESARFPTRGLLAPMRLKRSTVTSPDFDRRSLEGTLVMPNGSRTARDLPQPSSHRERKFNCKKTSACYSFSNFNNQEVEIHCSICYPT
ncbi:hypothetical protein T11_6040 [Trichinella zimbabwensis]|uniref:Uncharacterized protein n=1 Tax=Trichinella zimbabwensis TaxID=268475 RepID=A0A0V1I8D0_9BILA|nr:hypothetical protein T11_6040 [Trichinella zimbabwensis]